MRRLFASQRLVVVVCAFAIYWRSTFIILMDLSNIHTRSMMLEDNFHFSPMQNTNSSLFKNPTSAEDKHSISSTYFPNRISPEPIISIFYNTFIHVKAPENYKALADRIFQEQLDMINAQPLLNKSTIYYSRFGDLNYNNITKYCHEHRALHDEAQPDRPRCVEIAAATKGDELTTIQSMYDYCMNIPINNDSDYIVVYMHSKGTATPTRANMRLRDVLMKAIMSDECLLGVMTSPSAHFNTECNVCSHQLSMWPFISYTGNMFVTKCHYIKSLISPNEFKRKRTEIVERLHEATVYSNGTTMHMNVESADNNSILHKQTHVASYKLRNQNVTNDMQYITFTFPEEKSYQWYREPWLGVSRYAMEHWIGSHPDMRPCEVFSKLDVNPKLEYKNTNALNVSKLIPRLRRAPPPHMSKDYDTGFDFISLYQWQGRALFYQELYGKVPNGKGNGSWFYNYFYDNIQVKS